VAQYLPDAADLLGAIARLLDDTVLAAVPAELQHQVRVAANLTAILEREARRGAPAAARERALIAALLGGDLAPGDDPAAALDARLRAGVDDELAARAAAALVEITRADLAIAKPGHDAYEGR